MLQYAQYPSVPVPDLELLDGDPVSYLFSNPYDAPLDRPIFINAVYGGYRTYGDVLQCTRSLASGLRALDIQQDDVITVLSPNSIDYPIICYSIIGCGATVSPINTALTFQEAQRQLQTSQARHIIDHS